MLILFEGFSHLWILKRLEAEKVWDLRSSCGGEEHKRRDINTRSEYLFTRDLRRTKDKRVTRKRVGEGEGWFIWYLCRLTQRVSWVGLGWVRTFCEEGSESWILSNTKKEKKMRARGCRLLTWENRSQTVHFHSTPRSIEVTTWSSRHYNFLV